MRAAREVDQTLRSESQGNRRSRARRWATVAALCVIVSAASGPIWAQDSARTVEELEARRAELAERAAAVRARTRLAVSHEALLAAEAEVLALRDRAVPEAEAAFQAAQDAYLRGSMRFTDVLDTERLLFELKSRYFAALADYHGAVADIERLIGESFQMTRKGSGGIQP